MSGVILPTNTGLNIWRVEMKEADLKKTVIDLLQYKQNLGELVFFRLNSGDFIEVRGDTRRRIKGCMKGCADILVLRKKILYEQ